MLDKVTDEKEDLLHNRTPDPKQSGESRPGFLKQLVWALKNEKVGLAR